MTRAALFGLLACLALQPAALARGIGAEVDGWADIIRTEQARGNALPRLSDLVPGFTLDEAYAVQHALVAALRGQRAVGGYKAGFTNPATRARFGLNGPVTGVLFADGAYGDGDAIPLSRFRHAMLEVELGFVLRSPIRRPMKSVDDLATYVREVVPVVELPDLDYDQPERLSGVDIVATNLSAAAYVSGRPLRLASLAAANRLTVSLQRGGEVVDEGQARNAMGDQLGALLWMVNRLQADGWPLEAGHLLITGTLGRMLPAAPGHYRVSYGKAGSLAFDLVAAGEAQAQPK